MPEWGCRPNGTDVESDAGSPAYQGITYFAYLSSFSPLLTNDSRKAVKFQLRFYRGNVQQTS
jgi:hypothetical protein